MRTTLHLYRIQVPISLVNDLSTDRKAFLSHLFWFWGLHLCFRIAQTPLPMTISLLSYIIFHSLDPAWCQHAREIRQGDINHITHPKPEPRKNRQICGGKNTRLYRPETESTETLIYQNCLQDLYVTNAHFSPSKSCDMQMHGICHCVLFFLIPLFLPYSLWFFGI